MITRALSGLAVVTFPMAKNSGLAASFFRTGAEEDGCGHHVAVSRFPECWILYTGGIAAAVMTAAAAALTFLYYYRIVKKRIWRNYRRSCRIFSSGVRAGADSSLCGRFRGYWHKRNMKDGRRENIYDIYYWGGAWQGKTAFAETLAVDFVTMESGERVTVPAP